MNALRTLIVDDELPARLRIRSMLEDRDDVLVLAECRHGEQARDFILRESPDLVFLDIQMPELDGFEVMQSIGSKCPAVIFVTAFSEYAVRAFEVNAQDYLLKPFNAKRLNSAVDRVQRRLATANSLPESPKDPGKDDRIALKYAGRLHLVETSDIIWFEAARNYVRVHTSDKQYLLRESMKRLAGRLDPDRFVRVHRSVIINIEQVDSLEPGIHGTYQVILNGGSKVPLSRNYKASMQARFGDQI